jgi:hypothetical protein
MHAIAHEALSAGLKSIKQDVAFLSRHLITKLRHQSDLIQVVAQVANGLHVKRQRLVRVREPVSDLPQRVEIRQLIVTYQAKSK